METKLSQEDQERLRRTMTPKTREEVAFLRAEADAREAERHKLKAIIKERRQGRALFSLQAAVNWFKSVLQPAPAQTITRQWRRHAAQKLAKKQARLARRAQMCKAAEQPIHEAAERKRKAEKASAKQRRLAMQAQS